MKIHILNETGKFNNIDKQIQNDILIHAVSIKKFINLDKLDIVVSHMPDCANEIIGIGGGAFGGFRLDIFYDMDNPNIINNIKNELLSILAHETHHCARYRIVGNPKSLQDNLVTEGLACHFEEIVNGGRENLLFTNFKDGNWEQYYNKFRHLLPNTVFDFNCLFHGSSPTEFPKYTGYWVGYNLVLSHMRRHNLKWEDMVGINSETIQRT